MNPIVIQGAMEEETNILIKSLTRCRDINIYGFDFYEGYILDFPIIVSKTNVGEINATISTTIAIDKFKPSLIINQGIAGGSSRKIHKKDIIIGESCININSFKTPITQKGKGSDSLKWILQTFRTAEGDLVKLHANKDIVNLIKSDINGYEEGNIFYGTIGSGDVWNNETDRIDLLNKKYEILCEDMETIAVYDVCNKLRTNVLGYRMISNNILTNEEYDKNIGQELQKFSLHILNVIIKNGDKYEGSSNWWRTCWNDGSDYLCKK